MTTLIFSHGLITQKKSKQSIKSHIKEHEKRVWISEFMRISELDYKTALREFNKMETSK